MNLKHFVTLPSLTIERFSPLPKTLLVVGTGMNSGKTTSAANLIHTLSRAGASVMGCKLTGTGSGPDLWRFLDAGAAAAVDFTDAGLPSTWKHPVSELVAIAQRFKAFAQKQQHDYLVVELADGFIQQETAGILNDLTFRKLIDGCFIAADCTPGALLLVQHLSQLQISIRGISGTLTRSPLLSEEVARITGLPVLSPEHIQSLPVLNQYLGAMGIPESAA